MNNITRKNIVQNAENKKNVSSRDTKNRPNLSKFGISVKELAENFDVSDIEYEPTLAEDILRLCQQKGIKTDGDFEKKTSIFRVHYSRLKYNKYHILKKELLFSVFIGLELNTQKALKLMEKSGYSFFFDQAFEKEKKLPSFDRLIYECLCCRIYDIEEINKFLCENGYKERLGSVPRK